jgi:hypothetical protein
MATFVPMLRTTARSVRPPSDSAAVNSRPTFDRDHSAALFVGVRNFRNDTMPEVPFAVDDAIDLAYVFALNRNVSLVPSERVVLALSGEAVKPESRQRLCELRKAGARVTRADQIPALLEQQATLASRNGLLIVSFATHGLTQSGTPFILDEMSRPVSTANLQDIIAQHEVPRSLVLVDACRTRGPRGANANAFGASALRLKMPRVQGLVMISAMGEAYDDHVRRNGVFTENVIAGLDCKAALDRCCVTADTLSTFVEHGVYQWIAKHLGHKVPSAIQAQIDGEARGMPLAHCCVPQLAITLQAHNACITAFNDHQKLWAHDFGTPIVGHGIADQAAIVGTRSSLVAFDEAGRTIWSVNEHSPLRSLITGKIFQRQTRQIVALWGSRLSIYLSNGQLYSTYDQEQPLDHVAICQATPHYAPRIVVTSGNRVLYLDPKKVSTGRPVWQGHLIPNSETIARVKVVDHDDDRKADIEISTASGKRLYLDIKGNVIGHPEGLAFRREKHTRSARSRGSRGSYK